jgi:4-amino-4-deoxy-L-arabinose transferase-like glycosyltransferase
MSKIYDSSKTIAFKYFALFYIVAMFLPRLVVQGLFGDGLLYSSISRNMAIGKGSLWQPFFSSSYWLDNVPPIYYENPPLMLWMQSFFFQFMGDYWWVEKVYSLILLVLNCWLMLKIWQLFEQSKRVNLTGLGCLVLVLWYLMPRVLWGNPNNLMDNNLLTFCLLSIWFIFKAIFEEVKNVGEVSNLADVERQFNTPSVSAPNSSFITHHSSLVMAGFCIFLGILTKGPVALYPLAIPVLWAFFTKEITFKKAIIYTIILTAISSLLFVGLLYFNPAAKTYFGIYWEQRLLAVIVGSRDDMKLSGWQHLEILETLFIELLPVLIVFLIFYAALKIKKINIDIPKSNINLGLFFLFLGFSATLPIMISTKQSGIYLIPGLPMFAFSAAFFAMPFFERLVNLTMFERFSLRFKYFSWFGLAVSLMYSAVIMGNYERDKLLLSDVDNLKKVIPQDAKVGVCFEMMDNFVFHVNLQRFCRFELRKYTPTDYFLTRKTECDSVHRDSLLSIGFKPVDMENQYFVIYKK